MSKNVKKGSGLESLEQLLTTEEKTKLLEAELAQVEPVAEKNILSEDVINMVFAELEALPEVSMMAQIVALEGMLSDLNKANQRFVDSKAQAESQITRIQVDLIATEANTRERILGWKNIAELRNKWGEFFNRQVNLLVEQAKGLDTRYQLKLKELTDLQAACKKGEAGIKGNNRKMIAHNRTRKSIEKKLNALLKEQ